jgi:uncharacterized membrane protein YtjA (UPF0391 family)
MNAAGDFSPQNPDKGRRFMTGLGSAGGGMFSEMVGLFFTYKSTAMLRWTLIFLIIAIVAGIFGFFGIAASAAYVAKILFFIFIVLFLLSFVFGRRRGIGSGDIIP